MSKSAFRRIRDAVAGTGHARLAAVKEVRQRSERSPHKLLPHAMTFVGLLDDSNSIVRRNALLTMGHLAAAENGKTLEPLLDRLLETMTGPRLIDANCAMQAATAMALAKPKFAERVAARLMEAERGEYATPECRNVAIGKALEYLARLLPLIADRESVRAFAGRQADNPRPATRERAERLLKDVSGRCPACAD